MPQTRLALSVHQPFAWLIVNGFKDVENRPWSTKVRGPVLIHAGRTQPGEDAIQYFEQRYRLTIPRDELKFGGIVGEAVIVDCVDHHASKWFRVPFGFVLAKARPLPFKPVRARLKFFKVEA